MRNELSQKNVEIIELQSKLTNANNEKEEFKKRYENLRKEMVNLKKSMDLEKSQTLNKQAQELESLKNQIRTKQI